MIAHAGALGGWHDVPTAWSVEPVILLMLCLGVGIDAVLRRGAPRTKADYLALAGLVVALISPLDSLADGLVAAHMVQHLVLLFVVAPALAAARPWHYWRGAFGRRRRVQLTRLVRAVPMPLRRGPASAILPTAAATAALWIWHLPAAYDLAARSDWWHAVDHLCLIATTTWFWAALHRQRVAKQYGVALAMLAFTSMSGTALGGLLVFSPPGAYPRPLPALGLSAASDQHLAGLFMSMLPTLGLLVVMARVILDALAPLGDRSAHPPVRVAGG